MTLVPPGAQLAAVDLPPPHPHADPREPSPATHRGRGASTPHKVYSPQPSRGTSPVRPTTQRAPSSDTTGNLTSPAKASSPPLFAPTPRTLRAGSTGVPISGHHSRPVSPALSMDSSIFERDIEPQPVAPLSLNPNLTQGQTLNHKSSRLSHLSHGSHLDHTVPAVLDDAVEALSAGTSRGLEGLEIESPAPAGSSLGMARSMSNQIAGRKSSMTPGGGSLSRSPSPMPIPIGTGSSRSPVSPSRSPPILGQISTGNPVGGTISPIDKSPTSSFIETGNVPRPAMPGRMSTGPQVPGAWMFSDDKDKDKDRGRREDDKVSVAPSTAAIAEVAPAGAATAITTAEESSAPPPPAPGTAHPSAVPSHLTPSKDKRRISFISYNDLLLSVPTTVTHLGEITSGQLSPEHLPGTVSPNISRSPVPPPLNPLTPADSTSSVPQVSDGAGLGVGISEGEWSREGLGKGLEQRLEDLVSSKAA